MVIEPGDTLVMYSDGVTDAVDAAGASYGEARLSGLVKSKRGQPASAVCEAIFDDVANHRGPASAFDDVTVLVAARAGDHVR